MTRYQHGAVVLAVAVLLVAPPQAADSQERTVDPYSVSTRTCQALIVDSVEKEFPKAKGTAWDMDSVRETDVRDGTQLIGKGHYQGGSARRRFDFECTYDSKKGKVVSAWWVSSFDSKRQIVVEQEEESGWSLAQITKACRGAVKQVVVEEFPSNVRKLDFIDESIEHAEQDGLYELSGEGRFQGGGGTWRRFTFGCTFDESSEEVTEASWRHLGAESDLDLEE